uniref:EF-hand domain-containing protein n=1 Tax=Chromera velia CCMP2878 TaxID=1169474 RepID=A0A0G4I0J1_9ALVE|eukprot:Cvel_9944.t1-p1 / transcript=Cvel_9944.t1 / gene=Cvel_9944 / organism=Chromera_velia_CCMP2878 / gene_product=hypothetical protein / transcript_product=hypothetical protein / location=Cvel_scaffold588:53220-54609(+) / protein_length=373 / sequence_SO=supercontig / SO=protein_coding / is_pseudo=false
MRSHGPTFRQRGFPPEISPETVTLAVQEEKKKETASPSDPKGSKGQPGKNLEGVARKNPNEYIVKSFLFGQSLLAVVGVVLAAVFSLPLQEVLAAGVEPERLVNAALVGAGMAGGFAVLNLLPLDYIREIERDTDLFCLGLMGKDTKPGRVFLYSLALALGASVSEEIFFRGVLLPLGAQYLGEGVSLVVSSLIFGVGHTNTPGGSTLLEAGLGAVFGYLFISSGGNLLVPIVCHFVYDFITFVVSHTRGKARLEGVNIREKFLSDQVQKAKQFFKEADGEQFAAFCMQVFQLLDLDKNGFISVEELRQGLRVFDVSRFGIGRGGGNSAVSLPSDAEEEDSVEKAFNAIDTNGDRQISYEELMAFLSSRLRTQ